MRLSSCFWRFSVRTGAATVAFRPILLLLFNIPAGVELLDVSPQVVDLLPVLEAGEDHFGAADKRPGILYVFFEGFFFPNDARALVRIRIIKIRNSAGRAAVETIEFGPNFVFRGGAYSVAHLALLEHE